jgi:hypothetical protein
MLGTHNHRLWLWIPARAALGRDDDRLVRARSNLRLWEKIAGPDPLFPIVIYNGWRNSNVSSRKHAAARNEPCAEEVE